MNNSSSIFLILPSKGYFKRIWFYTKEMYPIQRRLFLAFIFVMSISYIAKSIQMDNGSIFDIYVILGTLAVFLILFILRLMDELKDVEIDKKLFAHRPIPSGRVSEKDIRSTLYLLIMIFLLLNCWDFTVFIAGFCLLCYTLLMYKYFFIPHILRDNLILNLSTHNPVVALIIIYVILCSLISSNMEINASKLISYTFLILMYWGIFFSWEISRKIRAKIDENEYVTYSQIFGIKGAVLITISSQAVTFLFATVLCMKYDFSLVYFIIISSAFLITLTMNLRFLLIPIPEYSNLSQYTENFALLTMSAPIIDYVLQIL